MNIKSKKTMLGLLSIAVLGGGMFAAGQAAASCVYNHTRNTEVSVDIEDHNLHVLAGEHGCTDGIGGYADVRKVINNASDQTICDGGIHVDDHGWLSVYDDGTDKYKTTAKDADKNITGTCYGP